MVISAKELAASEKKRRDVRKETYKALLEQFSRKIKTQSDMGARDALLTVPPFLIGFPRYALPKAVEYMHRQLVRLGYSVEHVRPTTFRVTWDRVSGEDPAQEQLTEPDDILPGLANLQKTAQRLRVHKSG